MMMHDSYDHHILKGQKYLKCNYFKKGREYGHYIQYEKMNREVFVLPGEIMLSEDFRQSKDEKQWLDDAS